MLLYTTYKSAKTIKEYKVKYGIGNCKYDITVPVGTSVNNKTACGFDDDYRFISGVSTKTLVGYDCSCLAHDLKYYGLNIPAEFCESYVEN